ncbi:MAG: SpoIID/LytB domain-containing protein [Candidatus Omnitrophota bacterium]|nr:SpoIID/LytB domain-containing protein [Candidatus Omnitrophota bacterium]
MDNLVPSYKLYVEFTILFMEKIIRLLMCFVLIMGLGLTKADGQATLLSQRDDRIIRVAILKDKGEFFLSIKGRFDIVHPQTGRVLKQDRLLRRSSVKAKGQGVAIGEIFFPMRHVKLRTSREAVVEIGDQVYRYRGDLDLHLSSSNQITVVNSLPLEKYVKGVLYHEVSNRWPMEAMKAQAVATRTYAVYQAQINKDGLYDVTSDIYSQVYGGKSAERYRTNLAVNRTQGEILIYQNRVLPAYFHANSGGHTEDAKELWDHDLPPLRGRPDPYSKGVEAYEWKKNFRSQDVREKLNAKGYAIGLIQDIQITERTASGRVKTLEMTDRDGQTKTISGKAFREIIGPNLIRSNLYDIIMKGYFFDMLGHGWGHGVGMAQWGAYAMAKNRHPYKDILAFYYPGALIIELKEWRDEVK